MRILVVSDLHGDLNSVDSRLRDSSTQFDPLMWGLGRPRPGRRACAKGVARFSPDLYDVRQPRPAGDAGPTAESGRFGGAAGSGKVHEIDGLRLAAIGGIWAKSHAKPHYVTDVDVEVAAARIARAGPVDILLTHACPIGLADLTPSGRHGGQRCFLDAFKVISPRLHLCGHLHLAQEHILKDGRKVINVGATPEGSVALVDFDANKKTLDATLEHMPSS